MDTILDHSVGPDDYTRDHALREQIIAHYRSNLSRVVDIAGSALAQVLLVTPASNLKDCSPFKSEHRRDSGPGEVQRLTVLLKRARKARASVRDDSLITLEQASAIDDRYADVHYQRGLILCELGEYEQVKTSLRRVLEEDVCPL